MPVPPRFPAFLSLFALLALANPYRRAVTPEPFVPAQYPGLFGNPVADVTSAGTPNAPERLQGFVFLRRIWGPDNP